MSISIEPLKHEEIEEFIKVWWESFEPADKDQVLPMVYPGGLKPDLVARLKHRIMAATNGDVTEYCYCAREQASSKIIGVIWWFTVTKPNTEAVAEDTNPDNQDLEAFLKNKNIGPPVAEMNEPLGDAFYTAMFRQERSVIKAKKVSYISLNVLGVLPGYERRGVGGALLQKGLEKVDVLNVWTFLIASKTGRGLYQKYGFEIAEELDFDGTKHGGRSPGKHWVMVRPPQNSSV